MTALMLEVLLIAVPLAWLLQRPLRPGPRQDPRPSFTAGADQVAQARTDDLVWRDWEQFLILAPRPLLDRAVREARRRQRRGARDATVAVEVLLLARTGQLR